MAVSSGIRKPSASCSNWTADSSLSPRNSTESPQTKNEERLAGQPAKAGIQSLVSAFPKVCRVDSRFRGNDRRLECIPMPNDTST